MQIGFIVGSDVKSEETKPKLTRPSMIREAHKLAGLEVRGREGYFVPASEFCFPAWKSYRALAIEALSNQMELTV